MWWGLVCCCGVPLDIGATPKLTIYPDAYHNSWDVTYNNPELYEWFLKHRLPARPSLSQPEDRK